MVLYRSGVARVQARGARVTHRNGTSKGGSSAARYPGLVEGPEGAEP